MTDRLPPHNDELEAAFLGCCLLGGRDAVGEVIANHRDVFGYFYDLRHQTLWGVFRDLAEAGQPVDPISAMALLEKRSCLENVGGLSYISDLPDKAPSAGALDYYAGQLRDLHIKRQSLAACAKVEAAVFGDNTAADVLETLEREMNSIGAENAPAEADIKALVQSAIGDIEDAHRNQGRPQGLSTGLSDLDRLTHGLRPGQFFVIGAGTSVGKTSLALNVAEYVALDCKLAVGFMELEMTAKELTLRLLSCRSGIALEKLLSGDLCEANFHAMTTATSAIAKAPMFIADESGITVSQLRAKARRMHRRHKLALLIVDYIQLIRPARANPSRNVEVSEVSSSLKALAKELSIPVIALSQLNRNSQSEGREPSLRDLRDSGSIEQDADIVGLLHRPKPEESLVQLHIAKHRQGPTRKIGLTFFGETFRFRTAGSEA